MLNAGAYEGRNVILSPVEDTLELGANLIQM